MGVPVKLEMVVRLSMGCDTIAQRPKATGGREGLKPSTFSLGVRGADALFMLLLSVSPID